MTLALPRQHTWDITASADTSYFYRVKARNAAGLSVRSAFFRADTPSAPTQDTDGTRSGALDLGDITPRDNPVFLRKSIDGGSDDVDYYRFELTASKMGGIGIEEAGNECGPVP